MRGRIAWTIALLIGALCFYQGLRMLWPRPWGTGQVIQPGTAISIRLFRPLTSASAQPGDSFEAYVVGSEPIKGGTPVLPGTRVEGRCLAVRRAATDSRPGYIRLALLGLRDSEGRFAPIETTTFSEWGGQSHGSGRAPGTPENLDNPSAFPPEGKASSNKPNASPDALLLSEETIKFVVLKPALFSTRFRLL